MAWSGEEKPTATHTREAKPTGTLSGEAKFITSLLLLTTGDYLLLTNGDKIIINQLTPDTWTKEAKPT